MRRTIARMEFRENGLFAIHVTVQCDKPTDFTVVGIVGFVPLVDDAVAAYDGVDRDRFEPLA